MFKGFDKRLTKEIKRNVDERLRITEEINKFKVFFKRFLKFFYFNSFISLNQSTLKLFHIICNDMLFGLAVA